MANGNGDDVTMPSPPAAPTKRLPTPLKVPRSNAIRYTAPGNVESFSDQDLMTDTRGPISNRAGVEREISAEETRRQRRRAAVERETSGPYKLKGGRKLNGGKR